MVVVDDKLAATHWPGQNPIGKRVRFGNYDNEAPWLTIVGIVRTVRHDGLDMESLGQAVVSGQGRQTGTLASLAMLATLP